MRARMSNSGTTRPTCRTSSSRTVEEIAALVKSFAAADLVIAEGGAWKNLIAHDDVTRKANLEYAVHQLALADELGAGAIVAYHGTVGHPGDPWQLSDNYDYGPHPDNQSEADSSARSIRPAMSSIW